MHSSGLALILLLYVPRGQLAQRMALAVVLTTMYIPGLHWVVVVGVPQVAESVRTPVQLMQRAIPA